MKTEEVIQKIIKDPDFTAELTKKIAELSSTSNLIGAHNNDLWRDILSHFAESPEELAKITPTGDAVAGSTTWTFTVTSAITSGATPAAPITVTTIITVTTVKM
jgi:hypothetical protein